jgi:hypothetical protein
MTHPLDYQSFKQHRLWPHVRSALVFCGIALAVLVIGGCTPSAPIAAKEVELVDQTVELACGECQFKLPGSGCNLAIRVNGKAYFVDGSSIDDHGDAHAEDGLCNAIRNAKVTGTVRDGRFESRKIELVNE